MVTIGMVLLIAACVCWLLAALNVPVPVVGLGWLGLFLYGLSLLIR